MKRNMIKLAAGAAAVLLMSTSAQAGYTMKKKVGDVDTKLTMFGFAQLEARGGDGFLAEDADAPVAFGAQRVRLGWKYQAGKVRGKVFLDFNKKHDTASSYTGAAMPDMIKDAFISYVVDPAFVIKAGLIKMPNGMSFTMPGWNLDIAERGFDKALAMERNTGLMFSGRDMFLGNNGKVDGFEMGHERPWKGFGYDIMVANQAVRSAAVSGASKGGGLAYNGRLMFDYTEALHLEASYAVTENAGGANTEDYSNINLGVDSNLGAWSLKGEYYNASDIKGTKGYDQQVYTGTVGWFAMPSLELVAKGVYGDAQGNGQEDTNLMNTYLGMNIYMSMPYQDFSRKAKRMRNQHKVVLNYIIASGDGATGYDSNANTWSGIGGYKDNAFIAQYQFKF